MGCEVWLIILTRISLFLDMAPCQIHANRRIDFVREGRGAGLDFCQGFLFFEVFFSGGEGSGEGV